eukprot:CAMPEP_0181131450 /NCGR_PEP_ID=MMETSP1071-20121207/30431_1 /TAXON_ID=35127 /ORGANISM="Thalassiosira sp., Strain NH16" /LENGTH=265 /DNA_ID=CAMNT_0023217643 /DNA_START=90 /DNA_END=887 /DNA_ORIENTATION=-
MAEGGMFPWKLQTIKQPKNGISGECRFVDLSKPLPDPPTGQTWMQDEGSREWRLVPVATAAAETDVVVLAAGTVGNVASGDAGVCAAVPVAVQTATPIVPNDGIATDGGIRYHEVLPTDTFQGICLRYRVTPTELRRANRMTTGTSLRLAPEKLVIPANNRNINLNAQGNLNREEKIAALLTRVSREARNKLSYAEARAYLEIADWDVSQAVEDVDEDFGWSLSADAVAHNTQASQPVHSARNVSEYGEESLPLVLEMRSGSMGD